MKPTKVSALFAYAFASALAAFGVSAFLVRNGFSLPISPVNLLLTLPTISVVFLIMAWPILRYRASVKRAIAKPETAKSTLIKRVDPFYAMRVALLSRAISISGSIFLGWHAGVLVALLRAPEASASGIWQLVFGLLGSISMIVVGLIVENACRVPPDATPPDAEASAA
ncbi:MAG: DUF3180 domain-containing protein [Microbacteriaceae bacterium]